MGDQSSEPDQSSSYRQSSVDQNPSETASPAILSERKPSQSGTPKSVSAPPSRKQSSARSLGSGPQPSRHSSKSDENDAPPQQSTQPVIKDPLPPEDATETAPVETDTLVRDDKPTETVVQDAPAETETVVQDADESAESYVQNAPAEAAAMHDQPPSHRSFASSKANSPVVQNSNRNFRNSKTSDASDQVDGKIGGSRKSSANAQSERRESVQSRRRSSVFRSTSVSVPERSSQDVGAERKESTGSRRSQPSLAKQSIPPLQTLDSNASLPDPDATSDAGSSPSPPPHLSSHKSSNATSQDIRLSIALLNAKNPFDGDSGRILREWSKMDNVESLTASSKSLSKSQKSQVSRLINQIKSVTDNTDSETEPSRISSPLQTRDGSQKLQTGGKDSRASSHHPYNVIFESDEAVSIDTRSGEAVAAPDIRDFRERLSKLSGNNGLSIPEDISNALVAIKKASDSESNRLQKILDVWYGELRQALLAENSTARDRIVVEFDRSMKDFVRSQRESVNLLHKDVDSLQHLCRSYSKAIHKKDKAIENLAEALAGQKELTILAKSFSAWKAEIEENRREKFLTLLANRFYHQKIVHRAWSAWRASVQDRWRQRVEKASQKRAEEVCAQMADQFDGRIAELEALVKRLREENRMYKQQLEQVNTKARNALLHGVTVLKTDLAAFPPKSVDGDSDPGSGMASSNPESGNSEKAAGNGSQQDDSRMRSLKTVTSGPIQYAVEKHDNSRKNSGQSSGNSNREESMGS